MLISSMISTFMHPRTFWILAKKWTSLSCLLYCQVKQAWSIVDPSILLAATPVGATTRTGPYFVPS